MTQNTVLRLWSPALTAELQARLERLQITHDRSRCYCFFAGVHRRKKTKYRALLHHAPLLMIVATGPKFVFAPWPE
jgi:hypothetical protein